MTKRLKHFRNNVIHSSFLLLLFSQLLNVIAVDFPNCIINHATSAVEQTEGRERKRRCTFPYIDAIYLNGYHHRCGGRGGGLSSCLLGCRIPASVWLTWAIVQHISTASSYVVKYPTTVRGGVPESVARFVVLHVFDIPSQNCLIIYITYQLHVFPIRGTLTCCGWIMFGFWSEGWDSLL